MRTRGTVASIAVLALSCSSLLWGGASREESGRDDRLVRTMKRFQHAEAPRPRLGAPIPFEENGPARRIVPDRLVVKLTAETASRAAALPEDGLPRGLASFDRFTEAHRIQDGQRLFQTHGKLFTGKNRDALLRNGMDRIYELVLPEADEAKVLELVEHLSRQPWVEYAEPVTYGEPLAAPNDTFYSSQWPHNNTGQGGGTIDADMDTQEAWDTTFGLKAVVIAVADTGTLLTHPDLNSNLVSNCGLSTGSCYDFADNDFNPSPFGDTHGTNTAGIVAARGNNNQGVAGTCYACSLMALKTCNAFGCTSTAFQNAILHAAAEGAKAITMSFCFPWEQAWVDAVNTARDMGTLSFASLGNSFGKQACTPATVPRALGIGGTDRDDERIFALGSHQWVTAPGEGIYTTSYNPGTGQGTYTGTFGGTSASSPFAAGVAGLLWARDTSLHVNEVASLLALGADDQVGLPAEDTPGFDVFYGHGRVNAERSVAMVTQEWLDIQEPQTLCGGTITIGYHNPAGCDGQTVTVSGDIGLDSVTATLSQVTAGGYCEATVDLDWALLETIDLGDSFLTIEHGETITAQKGALADVSHADCERDVCHWTGLTNWNFRDLIRGDCDGDGAFDPGHVIRIGPAFVNIETEPMTPPIMALTTDSPYLDFAIDGLAFSSEIPPYTGYTLDVDSDPMFTVRVLPGAPPNSTATIYVTFFSLDGWIGDSTACEDSGLSREIVVPLNRDTGPLAQEWNFDDATAQGWAPAPPHGTTTMSECDDYTWDQSEWTSAPTTDKPHQGAYAMRLGNGASYSTGIDAALQSPAFSVPTDGVLGFRIWADTEVDAPGFAYDGLTIEGKAVAASLWSPLPVSALGSFSSQPTLAGCFQSQFGISFPFGATEGIPLIAGDGAADSPFGDAYEYEHYVDLSGLSGQNAQVRFRAGSDSDSVEGSGVWVDTIRLYGAFTADTWPGFGPADISGSSASCPTSFDVSATTVPGAAGYRLYRSEDSCLDALTRSDVLATSGTPVFQDATVTQDVGYFYAVEGFEAGTTCPTTRVCLAGGCCSVAPADPTHLRVDRGGDDVKTSWDDPGIPGTTWFLYHNLGPDPSTWGAAQVVDITDADAGETGIQSFPVLPTPGAGACLYIKVTAVECGESPLF